MNVYSVDELLLKLIEIKSDGYSYVQLCELEKDTDTDGSVIPACMSFEAVGDYGICGFDYETVEAVPDEEVDEFACRGVHCPDRPYVMLKNEDIKASPSENE